MRGPLFFAAEPRRTYLTASTIGDKITSMEAQVEAVRRFNRFYTQRIGVLQEGLLASRFTLAQARVLFELGTHRSITAGELIARLGLDPGYLSRILQGLAESKLVTRKQSPEDGRRADLSLTAKGRKTFADLDQRSRRAIGELIRPLSPEHCSRLLDAMRTVQQTLSTASAPRRPSIAIRPYRIGDIGWAIERHGQLYADEFGWNQEFEALVATLFAGFATRHDATSEQFWVAEVEQQRAGCVFVARCDKDPQTAQLRCLLVDPWARGLGLGRRLVQECLGFSKAAGYQRITLWTNSVLGAARRIYESTGFSLVEESPHHSFGHDLLGQTWARVL
jgi:DNA-binding MarR family transcriptional regulator/N-acetylglutamate synthase-like GNAT family acetyltransferase